MAGLTGAAVIAVCFLATILIGNLLAAAAMGAYFYRHHPRLTIFP